MTNDNHSSRATGSVKTEWVSDCFDGLQVRVLDVRLHIETTQSLVDQIMDMLGSDFDEEEVSRETVLNITRACEVVLEKAHEQCHELDHQLDSASREEFPVGD